MSWPYQIKSFKQYQEDYSKSISNPEEFWEKIAENFTWNKEWDHILEYDLYNFQVKWFSGGQLNVSENCIDRHLNQNSDKTAIIWEPNDPNTPTRKLSYNDLFCKVNQLAKILLNHGIKKGDKVCIYMGMIPELAIAALACARIGAVHSIIFGGFSAKSISDRIQDAQAKMVITADGALRGNKTIPLKPIIDDALMNSPTVDKVIVYSHTNTPISMLKGRDVWWEDELNALSDKENTYVAPVPMEAEDDLFILYTSGSTGKPKGIVHTSAGYLIWAHYTFINVFQYEKSMIHFCTADIGWITGHSYILYGPLSAGATVLMYEGIPTYPDAGRYWEIVEKHNVNILYTAPTAIRSLMAYDDSYITKYNLDSLKVLGSVGEPINQEAWDWYNLKIGKNKLPIVDTWWQTETGGIMITNIAGVTPSRPTYATLPLPGIDPALVDEVGNTILENEKEGNLCIRAPWPGMLRTINGDHERCKKTYFSTYPGMYFTGDGSIRDKNGLYKITGRVDDVLNVSGHRLGTAEVENAINMHLGVIESAIVGIPHDIKGQGIYAFIIYNGTIEDPELTRQDILQTVTRIIGPIAKPDKIQFVSGLPKTRSGKIMRRILRKIAEGNTDDLGDVSTLLDPTIVQEILANRIS